MLKYYLLENHILKGSKYSIKLTLSIIKINFDKKIIIAVRTLKAALNNNSFSYIYLYLSNIIKAIR